MSLLYPIIWFVLMFISTKAVFVFVGMSSLVSMFPEGRRWWQFPSQIISLCIFALLVLSNPWTSIWK
jgi:hypothetical protein